MRDFKGMKRQRGRNRNGGGGKPQHNANRAFESNGPEGVKVRGAAQHVYEKYQQMARDAHTSGDRVLAENFLQHAEHYFRTLRAMQPQRPIAEIIGRDQFVSGFDIDFEDESGGEAPEGEAEALESAEAGQERRMEGRPRDDWRPREERPRDDRYASDRPREDRWSDRPRDDRFQGQGAAREDRPRDDRFQGDRPSRPYRDDRPRVTQGERRYEPRDAAGGDEPEPAPVSAGPTVDTGSILRADDGEISHAPAFLQARAPDGEETRRPRRRRAPRTFEGAESVPAESADEG